MRTKTNAYLNQFKYIDLDLSKYSSDIGDAVSRLPKGHNWGSVYITHNRSLARCIICDFTIDYNGFEWSAPLTSPFGYVPLSCQEHRMNQALK